MTRLRNLSLIRSRVISVIHNDFTDAFRVLAAVRDKIARLTRLNLIDSRGKLQLRDGGGGGGVRACVRARYVFCSLRRAAASRRKWRNAKPSVVSCCRCRQRCMFRAGYRGSGFATTCAPRRGTFFFSS